MPNEAHVRIDEGIKRGPRKPKIPRQATTKPTSVLENMEQGKLANLSIESVLERYIAGETSSKIAETYQVTRQGLAWWMRRHAEEDWREAQIVQAIERKEKAEDELETAQDALSLARAREQLRSAQWDLERLFSRLYGQKQELTVTHTIPSDVLREIRELGQELGVVADTLQLAPQQSPIIDVVPDPLDITKQE